MSLTAHTRRFLWATIGVIVPLAALLVLFPRHTAFYWMWAMDDGRSAVLVGAVYAGATLYYLMALRRDDWLETQAGLEGIFVVSAVLLLAVVLHWSAVRAWHLMTLVWLPAYYVPLLFVPYLFRLEGGWRRLPAADPDRIPQWAASWLTVRGVAYAAGAAAGLLFAGALSRAWPWTIDPVEVRLFLGQPATFLLPGLAVLRGNLFLRRHRLPLLYLGFLGVVHLAGLLLLRTPYRWGSPLGVLLPLMWLEWIVTPLLVLGGRLGPAGRSAAANAAAPGFAPSYPAAVRSGVALLGAVYLAIGVIGLLPLAAVNPPADGGRFLLRHIAVNGPHNVVHLLIGATAFVALRRADGARAWGRVVGIALLGLFAAGLLHAALAGFPSGRSLLGPVALNSAGHVFHLATGVVALIYGVARAGASAPDER